MRPTKGSARAWSRPLLALACALALGGALAGLARGELTQHGTLIVSLDGSISPLQLPRHRAVPVAVHFGGGLRTSDGTQLPRVTEMKLAVPGQAVISSRGLPVCPREELRGADTDTALAVCASALVGRGRLSAQVLLPGQRPFWMRVRLLVFNGRTGAGQQALFLHAYSAHPPIWAVIPFSIQRGKGWLGTTLSATLPPALGPWPRLAHFEMTLSRRYEVAGRRRSYISASCPLPRRQTAGFFTFSRISYVLPGGQDVSTAITRGCRAA